MLAPLRRPRRQPRLAPRCGDGAPLSIRRRAKRRRSRAHVRPVDGVRQGAPPHPRDGPAATTRRGAQAGRLCAHLSRRGPDAPPASARAWPVTRPMRPRPRHRRAGRGARQSGHETLAAVRALPRRPARAEPDGCRRRLPRDCRLGRGHAGARRTRPDVHRRRRRQPLERPGRSRRLLPRLRRRAGRSRDDRVLSYRTYRGRHRHAGRKPATEPPADAERWRGFLFAQFDPGGVADIADATWAEIDGAAA